LLITRTDFSVSAMELSCSSDRQKNAIMMIDFASRRNEGRKIRSTRFIRHRLLRSGDSYDDHGGHAGWLCRWLGADWRELRRPLGIAIVAV